MASGRALSGLLVQPSHRPCSTPDAVAPFPSRRARTTTLRSQNDRRHESRSRRSNSYSRIPSQYSGFSDVVGQLFRRNINGLANSDSDAWCSESVSWVRFERSIRSQTPRSGTVAQLLCNSLEGIGQHYTLPRIELMGVVLDPSPPVAA